MQKQAQRWRPDIALSALVLALGIGVATIGGNAMRLDVEVYAEADFNRTALRVTNEIWRRFNHPINALSGARALYAANRGVTRSQFRDYIEARDLSRDYPGVRGIGFIERVARDKLDAFVAAERADRAPHFAIRQLDDKNHADLYVRQRK